MQSTGLRVKPAHLRQIGNVLQKGYAHLRQRRVLQVVLSTVAGTIHGPEAHGGGNLPCRRAHPRLAPQPGARAVVATVLANFVLEVGFDVGKFAGPCCFISVSHGETRDVFRQGVGGILLRALGFRGTPDILNQHLQKTQCVVAATHQRVWDEELGGHCVCQPAPHLLWRADVLKVHGVKVSCGQRPHDSFPAGVIHSRRLHPVDVDDGEDKQSNIDKNVAQLHAPQMLLHILVTLRHERKESGQKGHLLCKIHGTGASGCGALRLSGVVARLVRTAPPRFPACFGQNVGQLLVHHPCIFRCLLHQTKMRVLVLREATLDREFIMNFCIAHGLEDEIHFRKAPVQAGIFPQVLGFHVFVNPEAEVVLEFRIWDAVRHQHCVDVSTF
mmetsp:Transcript_33790/g.78122  ORF Transcript_33790/g.78122 Transcript_33790/m.78122 type:complete len:386 (+) Transcript_33790:1027-2184(+)